jgi:hypothetical protein
LGGVYPIKHSDFREEIDPARFGSAHFPSNSRAEHGEELQGSGIRTHKVLVT